MDIRSGSSANQMALAAETRARLDAEKRARQAEQEAEERIDQAESRADQLEEEAEIRAHRQVQGAETEAEFEIAKIRQRLDSAKTEGYAQLRDLKRKTDAEYLRTRSTADRTTDELRDHYRDELDRLQHDGGRALKETFAKQVQAYEFESRKSRDESRQLKAQHAAEVETMHHANEDVKSRLISGAKRDQEQLQHRIGEEKLAAENRFNEQLQGTVKKHQDSLARLDAEGSRQIDALRQERAEKLSRYDSRLEDPFYRVVDTGAKLEETDEAFILRAKIPVHEQAGVKAAVQGNRIVLSGTRRSEERQELAPGRSQSTSSYQSFQESFPIDWPVHGNSMLRDTDGDELIFTFPKHAGLVDPETGSKRTLDPTLYSRPKSSRPELPEGSVALQPAAPRARKPIA